MADINKLMIVGRLTRPAEQSYTQTGFAVIKFSIAVNRRRKKNEEWVDEANFFDVTSFGRQGEAIANYLTKGQQVAIEGQLRQDRWEAQDGTKRSKVYVEANYIQLLGSGSRKEDSPYSRTDDNSWSGPDQDASHAPPPSSMSFEDDIPF